MFDFKRSCTVVDVPDKEPLPFKLGYDTNWKYAVIKELITVEYTHQVFQGRQITVGDVLFSINEHMTLNDDISDILLFLETLKECNFDRKITFLDPSRVAEAAQLQTKTHSKDLLGFSRDIDYLLGEKVYNSTNLYSTAKRDLEWVAYLKHIGGSDNLKPAGNFKPSAELKNMVRRGIPAAYRSLIWQKVSLSSIHRLTYPVSYYSDLLEKSDLLHKKVVDDIEKDVKRTFPEHDYFDKGVGGDSLRRVLKAYATHNTSVGYCQSLNFISGMMLLFLQEEDAFWLLLTVVDTLLPVDCYSKSMIGTHVDQLVFAQIVETSLPKLHTALLATQMDLSLVTVPWFMCLFVNTLRPEVTLRVWDMFLCEGSKVLFRISAALLKKNEEVLVAASTRDSTELFIEMKKIGRNELDADALIAMAYKSYVPPFMKQRSLFTTSRSTGNLANSGRRGAGEVDAPLRKYNEASTVPPVLIGLGVAHTGPVMPLSPATSPLHSSSPFLFPPSIMDPSLVHLNKENENTNQVDLENGMKHWNQAQDPHGKDLKLKTFKEMKSKSERSFRPKIATPEAYSMSLSLPLSCLPELHVQTSVEVEEMLKNPVTARENERFASRQEGMVEATHSITDCCFDRTVMMQLGMSAFRSIPHNVETKSEGITNHLPSEVTSLSTFSSSSSSSSTNHATSETGTPLSVTNIRVTNGTPSSPPASKSASTPTPIPLGITNRTVSKKKSKNYRNASSLFNILLSSNLSSTSKNSTDEYRSFKRSDIDRLREAFRQILMSRFP